MKKGRKILGIILLLSLSINMTAFASDSQYCVGEISNNYCTETARESDVMPIYTANVSFTDVQPSHGVFGTNQFNLAVGTEITCVFNSPGKFSLAVYNRDTGKIWVSDTVHDGSCSAVLTIDVAGTYSIGVYNRDTKTINVTGYYTL